MTSLKEKLFDELYEEQYSRISEDDIPEVEYKGLQKMQRYLTVLLKDPQPLERHQFDAMIEHLPQALLWCYGTLYFEDNKEKWMKMLELTHMKTSLIIIIKRQHGKTEIMIRIVGAAMLSFPNMDGEIKAEYCLISHKEAHAMKNLKRLGNYLLKKIEYLDDFKCSKHHLVSNKGIILINKDNEFDSRVIQVNAGNIDGMAKPRFIFDEFFKAKEDIVNVQMPPMLTLPEATLLAASTLKGQGHWCTGWLKESDNSLYKLCNFGEICQACMKLPAEEAILCRHMRSIQAGFVNLGKRMQIMNIMDMEKQWTEMWNVLPQRHNAVFEEDFLKKGFERKCRKDIYFDEYFMFGDPSMTSEAGSSSACAIVGSDSYGNIILYSLSNQITNSNTSICEFFTKCLVSFVRKFQPESPCMKDKTNESFRVFASVEHNTVNHTPELIKRFSQDTCLRDCIVFIKGIRSKKPILSKEQKRWVNNRGGQTKRPGDEEIWVNLVSDLFNNKKWHVHPDCITNNLHGNIGLTISAAIKEMCNVREKIMPTSAKPKVVSKFNCDGKQTHNDLWVSIGSAITNVRDCKEEIGRFNEQYKDRTPFNHIMEHYENEPILIEEEYQDLQLENITM